MEYYLWPDGTNAVAAGELLSKLCRENKGKLTPGMVLKAAKPKGSLIHDWFEWDDTAAAARYRDWQARKLIRSVEIVRGTDEEPVRVRAFINIERGSCEYENIVVAMSSKTKREKILAQAFEDLEVWRKKYKALKEFGPVRRAISQVRRKNSKLTTAPRA